MAKALAVIDLETTGLNPYWHHRIVEVAALIYVPGEGTKAEFATLVNPERDIGPTSIHGITASELVDAPRFADIAGPLARFLSNASVLVGHNVRFDIGFLQKEYQRLGADVPQYQTLDTMHLAGGGTLSLCCESYGIRFQGHQHAALDDARATLCLLEALLDRNRLMNCAAADPPPWPNLPLGSARLCPRGPSARAERRSPSCLKQLSEQLSLGVTQQFSPEGAQAYTELLYRVLEDGCITECEGKDLIALAKDWGLSWECVSRIHRAFVQELVQAASADGRLSQAEQVHIASVARLLSLGEYSVEQFATLSPPLEDQPIANRNTTATQDWRGKSVCFTGECSCRLHNELITRELAEEMAADRGLIVKPSVTKKLDLLVVSDPHTQSGKAKKAREYGIRIIWEPLFWRSLGIDVD